MIDFLTALESLRPKAQWSIHGKSYADIKWLDKEDTLPTEAEIKTEILRLQAKKVTDKQASLAKLTALGLTADDVKNILGS